MLVGCGLNGFGAADTEILRVDGATVVTSQTDGLHVNTEPGEAGIVLGYSRSVGLLPGVLPGILPGQYPLGVSLRGAKPVALFRRVVGLQIGLNESMVGLSLGITEQMKTVTVDADATITRRLSSYRIILIEAWCECAREAANASGHALILLASLRISTHGM
jgi:hypothetical protein